MHRRACFGLLALAATGLTLAGWWIGEWMKLQPCPLCIFQRLLYLLIAGVALAGLLLPGWRYLWGGLISLSAAGGLATAAYQSWLQYLPDASMACGFGEPNLIERIVDWFGVRWPAMFMASGFCSSKDWVFLGLSMANWLVNVAGSTTLGALNVFDAKQSVKSIDASRITEWIYAENTVSGATKYPYLTQYMSFNAPVEATAGSQCGRMVFSDIHVASGDRGTAFPSECKSTGMTAQEKALEFMLFDLSSRVCDETLPPPPPTCTKITDCSCMSNSLIV